MWTLVFCVLCPVTKDTVLWKVNRIRFSNQLRFSKTLCKWMASQEILYVFH